MGGAKHAMIQRQEHHQLATTYLVRQGALKQCPVHYEVYGGGMDLGDEFWRNAMADKKRGEKGPVPWAANMETREYTDLIKAAYEDHFGDECGYCTKNRDRD